MGKLDGMATPATGTEAPGLCLARTCNQSFLSLSGHFSSLLPGTASLDLFKNLFFPALYNHRELLPGSAGETFQSPESCGRGKAGCRMGTLKSRNGDRCKPLTVPPVATLAGDTWSLELSFCLSVASLHSCGHSRVPDTARGLLSEARTASVVPSPTVAQARGDCQTRDSTPKTARVFMHQ